MGETEKNNDTADTQNDSSNSRISAATNENNKTATIGQRRSACGLRTEVYSRVVGYFRPIQQWNKGKQQEFKDRKTFDLPGAKVGETHEQKSVEKNADRTEAPAGGA